MQCPVGGHLKITHTASNYIYVNFHTYIHAYIHTHLELKRTLFHFYFLSLTPHAHTLCATLHNNFNTTNCAGMTGGRWKVGLARDVLLRVFFLLEEKANEQFRKQLAMRKHEVYVIWSMKPTPLQLWVVKWSNSIGDPMEKFKQFGLEKEIS